MIAMPEPANRLAQALEGGVVELGDHAAAAQPGGEVRGAVAVLGVAVVVVALRVMQHSRAVETGDPATAIGAYVRVMSTLGVSAEHALLGGCNLAGTGGFGGRPLEAGCARGAGSRVRREP